MKTLILYISNHGTTEKVALRLSMLPGFENSSLVNLKKETPPSLEGFDTVIIGGSIHAGKIQRKIQDYCETNLEKLLTKRVGLFICCMDTKHQQEEFDNAYPEVLRLNAFATGIFGGEFLFDKMNFFEKLIVRKLTSFKESVNRLDEDAIQKFAAAFSSLQQVH